MPFGESFERKKYNADSGRKDSPYFPGKEGSYIIRILDEDSVAFYDYWIPVMIGGQKVRRSVIVARDNPIKTYMDSLGEDNPGFSRPRRRFAINVLNRTLVRIAPDGTVVYQEKNKWPESVKDAPTQPLNKVQILEFGSQLADNFMMMHNQVRHREDFERVLKIQEFDLQLSIRGSGLEKKSMVIQHIDMNPLPTELATLPRYDLRKIKAPLPNAAVQRLLDGEEYSEVMDSLGFEKGVYPMIQPGVVSTDDDIPF